MLADKTVRRIALPGSIRALRAAVAEAFQLEGEKFMLASCDGQD